MVKLKKKMSTDRHLLDQGQQLRELQKVKVTTTIEPVYI